jgi:diguanylate cyclase (GGDEF)-like protein
VRSYLIYKWFASVALVFHFTLRIFLNQPAITTELLLYNAIVLAAILSLYKAPLHNDSFVVAFTSVGCTFWALGSIVSSFSEFFKLGSTFLANILYLLFYPFILLAIPRIIGKKVKLQFLEILDAAIFGLGLSSIVTALLLSKFIPELPGSNTESFFSILYPVCDLALVVTVVICSITTGFSKKIAFLLIGVIAFAITDFYFLWIQISGTYQFGQLSDDGWLLGIVLLSLSLWYEPASSGDEARIHPALIAVSIFISPALLSAIVIAPDYFPIYVIIPTIATLFLAFIRMTLVIRQASNLGDEKILARTDELTGLPNRRHLIAEIEAFSGVEGALMLLDLDGFKPVNDNYGHEMGDLVLRQVAQRFSRSLPSGAVLARLGGDEFGVLVSGNSDHTLEIANALRATLSYPFLINGKSIAMSVSIGHVRNDGEGELLKRADSAMYEAKRNGLAIVQAQSYQP